MSLFTMFADLRGLTKQARRIADALDRAYPIPKPEDLAAAPAVLEDVSYASDEATAMEEMKEEARRRGLLNDDDELAEEGEVWPPIEEDKPSIPNA